MGIIDKLKSKFNKNEKNDNANNDISDEQIESIVNDLKSNDIKDALTEEQKELYVKQLNSMISNYYKWDIMIPDSGMKSRLSSMAGLKIEKDGFLFVEHDGAGNIENAGYLDIVFANETTIKMLRDFLNRKSYTLEEVFDRGDVDLTDFLNSGTPIHPAIFRYFPNLKVSNKFWNQYANKFGITACNNKCYLTQMIDGKNYLIEEFTGSQGCNLVLYASDKIKSLKSLPDECFDSVESNIVCLLIAKYKLQKEADAYIEKHGSISESQIKKINKQTEKLDQFLSEKRKKCINNEENL